MDQTTNFDLLAESQSSKTLRINELIDAVSPAGIFGRRPSTTTALTWGYYGGRWGGTSIANGTVTLIDGGSPASATNYVVANRSTGVVSVSDISTNWDNTSTYARLYLVTVAFGLVTDYQDHRAGVNGSNVGSFQPLDSDLTTIAGLTATTDNFMQAKSSAWASRTPAQAAVDLQGAGLDVDMAGFRGIPQNSQSGNYTTVAADAGKHLLHPSGAGAGDTFTIDSNANVAYEVGTAITFVNMATDSVSIAITSDTMNLAGAGTTGTRTLAQYGVATAVKVTSTGWIISGTGLT